MTMSVPEKAAGISAEDALELADLLQHVAEATDASELAQRACTQTRHLLGADGVTFVVSEGDLVYYAEEDAAGQLWKGRRFPATACISGWAIQHRAAAFVEDIETDPRIPIDAYRPTFVKSLVMLPLGREEPLGALGVYWASQHRATAREMFLLERIARALHAALRHCRAAVEVRKRTDGRHVDGLRVLSVIAHDLRNPLAAVMNSAQTLRARSARPPTDTQREAAVSRIQRGAAHATQLVEQLLQYVKLEQGGLPLNIQATNLNEVCAAAIDEVKASRPACHIRMRGDADSGLWDAQRLTDVVGNLVRNAAEHGEADGNIDVQVGADDDECWISVRNDGPPIPPEFLPHLFEPFRQGPDSDSLGLGLYISHQIVRAHGGRIDVESKQGTRTLFRVRLPRQLGVLRPETLHEAIAATSPSF